MEFEGYNEIIRQWTQGVLDTYRKDAELTIKYCNELIDYGSRTADPKILGFAYYYLAGTLYCLNDCENIFDICIKAIENLEKASAWDLLAKAYNILGIITSGRGNLPVAYDYYLDGLMYCEKYNLRAESSLISINCGVLNIEAGRCREAMDYFERALTYILSFPDEPDYHTKAIAALENIIMCKVLENDFDGIDGMLEEIEVHHMPYADAVDRMGILISKAFYLHKSGQTEKRDACIAEIDGNITKSLIYMDLIEDFFVYADVLYEAEKTEEFWHLIDIMDPMISSMSVTSMKMKILAVKIKFYRRHAMNAEYLQAAGLYYELSERREQESRDMMSEVIGLRNRFEKINLAKKRIEKENMLLAEKSETDALTGMANRRKLNIHADEIFRGAYKRGHCVAIEILDVDYFKEFNDNYGHQAGDQCLIDIANCIKAVASEHGGFCARYGGDEFVIIYEGISREEAGRYAEELKQKVLSMEIPHRYSKALPVVTISQGSFCDVPSAANKVWDFLHIADDMLYQIKKQSRNSYAVADKSTYPGRRDVQV